MMLNPRVVSSKLSDVLRHIPNSNATLFLINQATVDLNAFSQYGPVYKAKLGNSKDHAIHYSIQFNHRSNRADDRDEENFVDKKAAGIEKNNPLSYTDMTIKKNKFGILEEKTPLAINVNAAGVFVPDFELMNVCVEKGLLIPGAYYSLNPKLKEKYASVKVPFNNSEKDLSGSWRFAEIVKSPNFKEVLAEELRNFYIESVGAVKDIYETQKEFMDAKGYTLPEIDKYKGYIPDYDSFYGTSSE